MTFHAHANEYSARNMMQADRNYQRMINDARTAHALMLDASEQLASMIGFETPAWKTFWANIAEDASVIMIMVALRDEIKRINDAGIIADHEDDRELHEQLKRGG